MTLLVLCTMIIRVSFKGEIYEEKMFRKIVRNF